MDEGRGCFCLFLATRGAVQAHADRARRAMPATGIAAGREGPRGA